MPNLVVYVPAGIWRQLEKIEGPAVREVARAIANQALLEYTRSAPGVFAPSKASGTSGTAAITAGSGSGADIPDE